MASRFLDTYGTSAGIVDNYKRYMNILGGDNRYIDLFPKLTENATFILGDKERHFISQELKIKTEPYIKIVGEGVEYTVNIMGTYHQLKLFMSYKNIRINTQSLVKDLNNEHEMIPIPSAWDVTDIIDKFAPIEISNFIKSILDQEPFEMKKEYIVVLREKLFYSETDETIKNTLSVAFVRMTKVLNKTIPPSDRDSYLYKFIRTSDRMLYESIVKCTEDNTDKYIKSLKKQLIEGNVIIRGTVYNKMASIISRRSKADALSSIRKIVLPANEDSPNLVMRDIHPTQKGFICVCETSDSKNAGLIKYFACTCLVSGPQDISSILRFIYSCKSSEIPVIVDGIVVGFHEINRKEIKTRFPEISVYINDNVIYVRTHYGRPIRPMIDKSSSSVFFIDPAEQLYHGEEYNEYAIGASLGITASLIPYIEHNQAARSVFACNIIKQAIDSTPPNKYDEESRVLVYGQKPLVDTEVNRSINESVLRGSNVTIAIMTFQGYNQEDSVIINKAAVDRGLFQTIQYKDIKRRVQKPYIEFRDEKNIPHILEGSSSKTCTIVENKVKGKSRELGTKTLDVINSPDKQDRVYTFIKEHTPEVGDKIASRHAQKSIIALLMNQEDMPFNQDGISPDIIINPHAIPSRMTVGQLIESLEGKKCAVNGLFSDGSPFSSKDFLDKVDLGTEFLTNGMTGEPIEKSITMGIVYYMVLKHQVEDKIFSRYEGPVSKLSRQPVSGKAREGGLRLGEMEVDSLIAHEAYDIINQISKQSDEVEVSFCESCGKRVSGKCARHATSIKEKMPMSRVVTEDLLAAAGIGVKVRKRFSI